MKNPVYLTLLSTLAGVLALQFSTTGTNQEASPFARTQDSSPEVAAVQEVRSGGGGTSLGVGVGRAGRFPGLTTTVRHKSSSQLRELMKQYKEADRDEKDDLESKIRSLLEEQYDAFLVQNEEQIEQLQERLNRLKDQLDRRRSAKNKMVDLEFERMANEADGLIWPNRSPRGISSWNTQSTPFGLAPAGVPTRPDPAPPRAALPSGVAR